MAVPFEEYHGRRIVERLDLKPGSYVLDVYTSSGAAAVAAAVSVAPHGKVVAVDPSEAQLERAAQRAVRAGAVNIEWHAGRAEALPFGDGQFDAVICAFGIFLTRDMTAAARELWRLVRPGGALAITTWREGSFEPANASFWNAIRRVRPSVFRRFNPWEAIDTPEALADLLAAAGIAGGSIAVQPYEYSMPTSEGWWAMVEGPGYRDVINQLAPLERDLVEIMTMRPLRAGGVLSVDAGALYAIARK